MLKILKNYSRNTVSTNFRGRKYTFPGKKAFTFDDTDEEQNALYFHWTGIYKFIHDITVNILKYRK